MKRILEHERCEFIKSLGNEFFGNEYCLFSGKKCMYEDDIYKCPHRKNLLAVKEMVEASIGDKEVLYV